MALTVTSQCLMETHITYHSSAWLKVDQCSLSSTQAPRAVAGGVTVRLSQGLLWELIRLKQKQFVLLVGPMEMPVFLLSWLRMTRVSFRNSILVSFEYIVAHEKHPCNRGTPFRISAAWNRGSWSRFCPPTMASKWFLELPFSQPLVLLDFDPTTIFTAFVRYSNPLY